MHYCWRLVIPKLRRHLRYQVLLPNDDYTPIGFLLLWCCSNFLLWIFKKATQVMLHVHTMVVVCVGSIRVKWLKSKVARINEFSGYITSAVMYDETGINPYIPILLGLYNGPNGV